MLKKIIGFLNQDLLGQKSWRNSLFFGWRWILLVTILGLLFIPLLLIGIFFPLVVISIILIIILLFYKFKTKFSVKLTISLILGIASFIFNIILILNSNATIYLIFSFFTSLFSLIAFYVLIVLARFNFSQAYNNFIPDNQVIELNNILPLKPNLEIFSSNKAEIKSFNTNDNSNHKSIIFEEKKNIIKDIIEVGNLKPVLIPKRPQFLEIKPLHSQPNLKITNPDFSNIQNKLKDLPATGVFYINSLQLPYKRAILDREFFELETVKLYLELCNKTDDILRKKDFSLQKRIKESSQEYFDYDNTLYTLFCISEFSILNHYFPNKKDTNPNFSYDLLNKQLKFNISNLIQNFVNQKISNLPEIPQKLYYSLNRNKWREVLEKLLQVEYDLVKLKQKCDELLDLNSQNPSQYLIYLELCSQFAKRSKTASLWYYYKYYELLTFKNSPSLNLPEAKPLPVNIAKVIFEGDKEKLSQFEILCKTRSEFESPEQSLATTTRNPLNYSDEAKKEKIKNLFAIKRKVLKLDLSETKKLSKNIPK